jgi:pyrimidine-specific ribonucleoside hydrolase
MNKIIVFIILFFCFFFYVSANEKTKIIIDTDGGADDLRAISLILSSNKFEVDAITTSDGVLSPETALKKVRDLLCTLNHEGIPTAKGRKTISDPCFCRKINEKIIWGDSCDMYSTNFPSSSELISRVLNETSGAVIFFAMSSLTNLNDALLLNHENKENISKIIWYNSPPLFSNGFNYESDTAAAINILKQTIPIIFVQNNDNSPVTFNEYFLNIYEKSDNITGENVYKALSVPEVLSVIKSGHFKLWDELLPIYFVFPELFSEKKLEQSIIEVQLLSNIKQQKIGACINEFLSPESEQNIVFNKFPEASGMFTADFKLYSDSILKKYGEREFRAGILANELHGHLGVYAIIGVKMGIRALDYFHCDIDELEVTSYTGNTPPLSCMNDGIQVSTGATLGHGLITVVNSKSDNAMAAFYHENNGIEISLKKEITGQIQNDFKTIIAKNGLFTDEYWHQIRLLAIKYWFEFDRNKIFNLTPIIKN